MHKVHYNIIEKIDKYLTESQREPDDIFLTAKYPYVKQDNKDKVVARKIGYKDHADALFGCSECKYYSVFDERIDEFGECRNKTNARKTGGNSWCLRMLHVWNEGGCPQFDEALEE